MELEKSLVLEMLGDLEDDTEPVGCPRRAEPLADIGLDELIGDSLLEGWTGLAWGMPHPELDVRFPGDTVLLHHGAQVLVLILSAVIELSNPVLVDVADQLADWFGCP